MLRSDKGHSSACTLAHHLRSFGNNLTGMRFNLSEVNELIRSRRTIFPEQYTPRAVHKEIIDVILTNATWAPTHGMTQPWRFKIFTGESRAKLAEAVAGLYRSSTPAESFKQAKFDRFHQRMQRSSAVIAVCMHRDRTGKIAEIEEVEAVACAIQNMYLSCTAYGLGAFWSTPKFMYSREMNQFLGLEDPDKCLGLFYLGYTDIEWPNSHRKPLEYVAEWME